ncbi:hypothetical protein NUW58_g8525 [Xylaria curta]|uniref:Uncharacterized protein n=1 Tax=Xylaria curta TaxID=42375 RepID=A0ACC1N8A3_9PEZI|nr:hypothetical protein NUW58_g8525 [Xylaria curta]
MATAKTIYTSYIQCINEERWHDLSKFASFPLNLNGETIPSPEALEDKLKAGERLQLDIDAITADEQTQRLGAALLAKLQLKDSDNRAIDFIEQSIIWIENGKICRVATTRDHDEVERQLAGVQHVPTPDLISGYSTNNGLRDATGKVLSTRELEDTYRAYIGCINAQTMAMELSRFCHSHVTHNATRLSLDEYRGLIQEAFTAVPDIVFGIDTVIADEEAQRVAVRLEFTGTPTGRLAGAEPTGRSGELLRYL